MSAAEPSSRREVIARGIVAGGIVLWGSPVIQVFGAGPAIAQTLCGDVVTGVGNGDPITEDYDQDASCATAAGRARGNAANLLAGTCNENRCAEGAVCIVRYGEPMLTRGLPACGARVEAFCECTRPSPTTTTTAPGSASNGNPHDSNASVPV